MNLPRALVLSLVLVVTAKALPPAPSLAAPSAARTPPPSAPAADPVPRISVAPGDHDLGHSMKGYEIYSWQQPSGSWHYALLVGTNRLKSPSEITSAPLTEAELRASLRELPALEDVSFWCPISLLRESWLEAMAPAESLPDLELPPKATLDSLLAFAQPLGLHFSVCEPAQRAH